MDKSKFYSRVRATIYGGRLPPITVSNLEVILSYWINKYAKNAPEQLAYILATVLAEVGRNMHPVRETFATSDAQARHRLRHKTYAQSTPPYGHAYYGRGYVQLTWKYNYQSQEDKYGLPFVKFPDLVLSTENAIKILVEGMLAGDFNARGHGLSYYINNKKVDYVQARRTVNVLDRADEIAGYARKFEDALEYAANERASASILSTSDEDIIKATLLLPSLEHLAAQHSTRTTIMDGVVDEGTEDGADEIADFA